jgi:chromosome segregation ATPase
MRKTALSGEVVTQWANGFGIAKKDVADAESRLGISMESLNQWAKEKEEWKRTQKKWTANMEKLSQDNNRLRTAESKRIADLQSLRKAKEKAESTLAAVQAEWATMKREWQLAMDSVKKYKAAVANADTENRRLVRELEQGQMLAHANVKRLLQRFREATSAEIQVHTANALREWCEQAAELQLLRVDKANRELCGPGFWKLDKANCEAVQQNLTQDFMRIAMRHREEVKIMLEQHDELVGKLHAEMEAITEPVIPAGQEEGIPGEDDDDEETETEPSILGVLNED